MGFFSAIAKPFRGLGRIVRGKFKEGFRDLADTAKVAAPVLAATTGIGTPLALALGAGGGAVSEATRGKSFGDIVLGGAKGAAVTGGAKALASLPMGSSAVAPNFAGGAPQTAARSLGSRVLGGAGKVANWAKGNPEMALTTAGIGSDVYGSYRQGQALDRQADLEEEALRRRWQRQDATDPILQDIVRRLLVEPSYN